ncbi:MAG TPA: M56 family metallopeptidase [Pyrinomonadaceae bacterium]|nr:M56 family metallopeptidase [Pyrinomonadaceae bacterium]
MRNASQLVLTILLNASWQVAVVTMFAGCCSWLLRETAAWCRHSIWVAALVISLSLPIVSALNASTVSAEPNQTVSRSEVGPDTGRPVTTLKVVPGEQGTGLSPSFQIGRTQERSLDQPIRVNRNLAAGLLALYALVFLYRGFKLSRAWWRTRAIMRCTDSGSILPHAVAIIAKCQLAIGVRRVQVVSSASVPVPITAGLFHPLIILPEQLLRDADEEILLSAIGHELVHVARRDYILNLVYELIYLPLSFHPAAALIRRRIRQTRELCCDETVARTLLAPDVYARSLVRLIGTVPLAGRLADTTIGITDADILEVRIMSLLKTSKFNTRRNILLLVAACLLLAVPSIAAAAFAVQFDIDYLSNQEAQKQDLVVEASQKLERAREELQQKERELAERRSKNPTPQGEDLEKQRRMEIELQEASARLSQAQESQHLKETETAVRQLQERLAQIVKSYPGDEARMREVKERLEQLQRSLPEDQDRSRELRERLALVASQYPNAAQMAEHLQTLRRAQEEFAAQQDTMSQEKRKIEEKLKVKEEKFERDKYRVEVERAAKEDIEGQFKTKNKLYEKMIRRELDEDLRRKIEADVEYRSNDQISLAQQATMSMDRAIQIAVSQHPGKVLSCNLGRQKDGQVFYRLVIIGDKNSATHVWVSATDGQILKTERD